MNINIKKRAASLLLSIVMAFSAAVSFTFGNMPVSASTEPTQVEKPNMGIDFLLETVYVVGGHEFNPAEKVLMYSLKTGTDDRSLGRAKWQPSYSGEIDISRLIPRRPGRTYSIAFIWSDELAKGATSANVTAITLNGRQSINRNDVTYDNTASPAQIRASGPGFEVRIGNDVNYGDNWGAPIIGAEGSSATSLRFDASLLPTGGIAFARKAAVIPTEEGGGAGQFASSTIRVKLPSLPKPNNPVNPSRITLLPTGDKRITQGYFRGFTDRMEVLTSTADGGAQTWKTLEKNMTASAFNALFPEGGVEAVDGNYAFQVRTAARGKRSASAPVTLKFPVANYNTAVNGTASPTNPNN